MSQIMVSIICNTYNHERYIEEALVGFVSQETTFEYEILIHDDASTDRTADIIRGYEKKYPHLIKPIYQSENQFSKKVRITADIQYPRARGKYIAFCEGDDYWTDKSKLQRQYDLLEKNSEINICAHAAYTEIDGEIDNKLFPRKKDGVFTVESVIINDGDFVATASLMVRKNVLENVYKFFRVSSGDYAVQIMGAVDQGMIYIGRPMSVYRFQTPGSWSARTINNQTVKVNHYKKMIQFLVEVEKKLPVKYSTVIEFQKNAYMFELAKTERDCVKLKEAKKELCLQKNWKLYGYYIPRSRLRKFIKFHLPIKYWSRGRS